MFWAPKETHDCYYFWLTSVPKMGDLELSLDDIIKKKLKKKPAFRGKNNVGNAKKPIRRISDPNNRITKTAIIGGNKNTRAGLIRGKTQQTNVGDARLKIIQNQRQKMTDAREKLGKQADARIRLVKLRERQRVGPPGGRLPATFRADPILQRTVQSRINNSYYNDELMDVDDPSYLTRNFAEGAVINDSIYDYPYRNRPDGFYRTIENNVALTRVYEPEKNIYSWTKPLHISNDIGDIPVVRGNSRVSVTVGRSAPDWTMDDTPIVITKKIKPQETVSILKRSSSGSSFDSQAVRIIKDSPPLLKSKPPARTLSERFCQDGDASAQKINLLKAKLEASQKNSKSIPNVQPSPGHRIVVSNLVSSVTHEDVKELFEDIGELISSKVVRPGTAEVVYKLYKDAVKAVDVYHNRQLDGQPMKCLLVNNRTALAGAKLKGVGGKSIVEVDMTAFRKALHKKSTS